MRPILVFFATLIATGSVWAQKSPKENAQVWLGVNCSIYAADRYYVTMYSTQPGEPLPLSGAYDNWQGLGTAVSPGNLRAHIYPGRVYSLYVGCNTWNTADIHFDVPAGYTLYLGYFNMGRTPVTSFQANSVTMGATYHVSLELRPNDGAAQLPAAYALPPRVDDVTWAVSLGFTSSGATAGTLRWRSTSVSTDLLNALALTYVDPVTGEVYVERETDGAIKYISAPDCQARIFRNADTTTGYTLKFYPWNVDPGSDRSFPGSPTPIATYVVSSPGGQQVQIARTQDSITETWLLALSGNTTSLTQTNGNRIIKLDSTPDSPVAGQRTELTTVRYSGQNPVAATRRIYQNFAWGEELLSETADPGGANLTTSYSYFTAGWPTSGNAGKLASIQRPDGSWESYDYYDDFARWGQLAHIYKPWQDNPGVTPANAAPSNCQATTIAYQGQRAVFQDLPAGSTTTVFGTQVAGSSVSYGFGLLTPYNSWLYGAPLRTETAAVYAAPGTALTTVRKVFDSGVTPGTSGYTGSVSANPDFAGKLYSQTNPDGTRISAAYVRGTFANNLNANTGSWDSTSFVPNPGGGYWCDSYFKGASTAIAGADAVSVWNGMPVDPVYLLPNRSIRRDVIYSLDGSMVVELTYVYTGSGGYKLTAWNETDSVNGLWVTRTDSTGAHENRTYTAGRVNYEKHADGTETQYYFDNLLRVTNAVSLGQPSPGSGIPGMGNLEHHYTYDAAGNVLQDWLWDGSNALTTTRTFNLAGLPVTVTDPRGLTTTCNYTNGSRTVTATLPGGATKITDHYLDGSARYIAGTAQIAEYYAAGINGDGTLYRQTNISSGSSPRWTRVSSDWAGRNVREEHPAPPNASPATFSRQYFYNPAGQLIKSTESGLADTLFQYDGLGELEYTCLDVNANGTIELAGPDRVNRTRRQLVNLDSAWWWQTLTYVYNQDNNSAALLQSETQERLVPYLGNDWNGGNAVTSRRSYDVFRCLTTQRVDTNRTNHTVTTTTVLPDSSVNDVGIAFNGGYPVWQQTAQNLVSYSYYDNLRRLVKQTDPRTDPSSTPRIGYYTSGTGSIGQVAWRQDTAGNQTNYTYDSATGRLSTMTNPLGKAMRYDYSARGENIHAWGAATYPVEYAFNDYGECVSMRTYRDGANWDNPNWPGSGTADPTTWNYDPASGTLTSKTDAMNRAVGYAYDVRNQLKTRTWARGVTTNYSYSPATAEQTAVTYSDGTPALSYSYNRLGQTTTVGDVTGTRTFNYSPAYTYLTQEDLGAFVGTRSVSHQYDAFGRTTYLGAGATSSPGNEYGVGYGYDAYGRMNQAWIFSYTYTANSNLLATAAANGSAMTQTRTYETNRDLLASITIQWAGATKAGFGYTNDVLGRRTNVTETGEMFARYSSAGLARLWGYNDRSELTSDTTTLTGTGTAVSGRDFAFAYDNLGNRTTQQHFNGTNNYTTNALNQYTQIAGNVHFDVTGFAPAAATVMVNGSSAGVSRQGDYYAAGVWPGAVPFWQSQSVASSLGGNASRSAWLPGNPETFIYDADGNMTSDGRWDYAYDAENRLVAMQTHGFLSPGIMPNAAARRLEFKNDFLGRRVEKIVRAGYNGSSYTSVLSDIRYLYDGWNPIYEISVSGSAMWVSRLNVWGLDWSGTMQGAGGVGGLLATYDGINPYWQLPAYDGNGNVSAMISYSDGTLAAAYEYDAFGNTLRATGAAAGTNPFRFSTKNTDPETGLIYYGLRYYSPTLGRFINKDPIEEKGGLNLYAFNRNNSANHWDYLGQLDKTEEGNSSADDLTDYYYGDEDRVGGGSDAPPPEPTTVLPIMVVVATRDGSLAQGHLGNEFDRSAIDEFNSRFAAGSGLNGQDSFGNGGTVLALAPMHVTAPRPPSAPDPTPYPTINISMEDVSFAALVGAKDFVAGGADTLIATIQGTVNTIIHPIDAVQSFAAGIGTAAYYAATSQGRADVGGGINYLINTPQGARQLSRGVGGLTLAVIGAIAAGNSASKSDLSRLQSRFEGLAEKHLLPKYRVLDPNLKAGYRGSFKTGYVGNRLKKTFGRPINLSEFDIDYWIKSDVLFNKYGRTLRADEQFRLILSETPGFEGLRASKKGFSILFEPLSE